MLLLQKTKTMENTKLVEIARSFSYKYNLGDYSNIDFFCSQKATVPEEEAEETSKKLYQFCKKQVEQDLKDYLLERQQQDDKSEEPLFTRNN